VIWPHQRRDSGGPARAQRTGFGSGSGDLSRLPRVAIRWRPPNLRCDDAARRRVLQLPQHRPIGRPGCWRGVWARAHVLAGETSGRRAADVALVREWRWCWSIGFGSLRTGVLWVSTRLLTAGVSLRGFGGLVW